MPIVRGILDVCHVFPHETLSRDALLELYREFYSDEPFVQVYDCPRESNVSWQYRITSYNVCYTKLLRTHVENATDNGHVNRREVDSDVLVCQQRELLFHLEAVPVIDDVIRYEIIAYFRVVRGSRQLGASTSGTR